MITEFMVWELTLISFLTGMLVGIVGTVLAVKVMTRYNILEKKAQDYDALEKDFQAAQKLLNKKESE
jgi:uncharacterized membrane-anchored protein YhcB (DUF1043 family)